MRMHVHRRKWLRVLGPLMLVTVVAACAAQPPVPSDKYYRLQAVMAATPLGSPSLPGTLEVERFSADGLTAGRPIVYVDRSDPNQLQEYHYHFWTQPPTIMLRDELVSYLRAAKVADSVVTPELRVEPDHILTGRIRRMEQVIGQPIAAALELEIAVRRSSDGKLLFLKTYQHESLPTSRGVPAAVDALSEALNIVYSDLLADLRSL